MLFLQNNSEILFSLLIGSIGAVAGLYGALQSWMTKRRTRQLELELLVTKLDIDFSYELEEVNNQKILKGKVIFKNLGKTNLRISELDISAEDRSSKFSESYKGDSNIESVNEYNLNKFLGVSNSHLVTFGEKKHNFFINISDMIFAQRDNRIRLLTIEDNISSYITKSLDLMNEKLVSKEIELFETYFFKQLLSRDLRGFEIFPGGEKTQEFVLEYSGFGLLYLNVETTALRMLKGSINAHEKMKKWGSDVLNRNVISPENRIIFSNLAFEILKPSSGEIQKEKETFLILLK